ncbi:protein translocase subunit SecD [Aliiroseovarius sp.]|uniref:protein translocase subunit SecD n=1 Tax=Aliiroseovarius sp. TaxID=1872442 RepID=UPI003BA85614
MLQISLWKRLVIWGLVLLGLAFALPNAFYTRVEGHNDAVLEIEALGSTAEREAIAGAWPTWMPSSLVNLGLDLRGGAHLLAEVQVEDVYAARMNSIWQEVLAALREERATVGNIRRQDSPPDELRVSIGNAEAMPRALELVRALARPVVSLTGVGSTDIEVAGEGNDIIVTLSEAERIATDDRTMQQTLEIIRRRVDEAGTREPTIQRQGADRVLIQVPGLGTAQELKDLIGKTALLTFHPVVSRTTDPTTQAGPRQLVYPSQDEEGVRYVLEETPVVTGEELSNAQPSFDQNGLPAVNFTFDVSGARKFCQYTGDNVGQPFAIVLDAEVISAPRINEQICGGSGIITGNFTIESSTELAVLLRAGALPAELTYVQERTVGPELGQDSIDAGKIASIVAFIGVLVFMALSYGWFGMLANVALVLNVGLIFGLLSMIGATLTLPGIAGIVLTIGMAVDANVLVFERIREELKSGRGPARAIELGYEKALSAILDANITTFITAVILFVMGSGPVRGFSVTLGLGIITSVFTAIFVTRLMIVMWFERRKPKNLEV